MATFKPGDTAVVRTSGEVVFIMALRPTPEDCPFRQEALVKRPTANRDLGIVHKDDVFFLEELESPGDKLRKDYESFKELYSSGSDVSGMSTSGASN